MPEPKPGQSRLSHKSTSRPRPKRNYRYASIPDTRRFMRRTLAAAVASEGSRV